MEDRKKKRKSPDIAWGEVVAVCVLRHPPGGLRTFWPGAPDVRESPGSANRRARCRQGSPASDHGHLST